MINIFPNCWVYCNYTVHILFHSETKITLFYLSSFAFTRFRCTTPYHWLYHSLSLVVRLICLFINDRFPSNNFFIDSIDLVITDGIEYVRQVKIKKSKWKNPPGLRGKDKRGYWQRNFRIKNINTNRKW